MNKKLFAFDIDGTLLRSNHVLSKETIAALLKVKEKGNLLALCSGRPYLDMGPVFEQAPKDLFDYSICNNGTYFVNNVTNEKYTKHTLDFSLSKIIAEEGLKIGATFAIHTLENGAIRTKLFDDSNIPQWFIEQNHEVSSHIKWLSLDDTFDLASKSTITQISLRTSKDNAKKIYNSLIKELKNVDIYITNEIFIDVNPKNVSKLTGINDLISQINLSIDDVVAFGDSGNDIEMLKNVPLSFAMMNGTDEAKSVAKEIIGTNDEDAVAKKLLELIGE